jgi:hypothetical protein
MNWVKLTKNIYEKVVGNIESPAANKNKIKEI